MTGSKARTSETAAASVRRTADRSGNHTKRKEKEKMKNYKITVDGYTVGIVELTALEAQELEKDNGITVERI